MLLTEQSGNTPEKAKVGQQSSEEKLISVLIPCYNHEKFVGEAIQSVLSEKNVCLELLIADDHSSDCSVGVISGIKDERIRTFFFPENHGVVYTLNFLMEKSRGEYIAFLGSDDAYVQGKLQKQLAVLEQTPDIGAVFTRAEVIDQNGMPCTDNNVINQKLFQNDNLSREQWLRLFFEDGNQLCHSSAMIRRCVYDKVGNFQQAFRQLHDFDYWMRVLCHWDIYVLPEKLTKYRRVTVNNTSVSAQSDENEIRLVNEYSMIFASIFLEMPEKLFVNAFGDLCSGQLEKCESDRRRYEVLKQLRVAGRNVPMASFIYYCCVYDRSGKKQLFSDRHGELNQTIYRDTATKSADYGMGFKKELLQRIKRLILQKGRGMTT